MATRTEVLNDKLQQSATVQVATDLMDGASASMVRALADLNHLDPDVSVRAMRIALVADVHGTQAASVDRISRDLGKLFDM